VFTQNWRTKLGYLLIKPGMQAMRKRIDYKEYGGAPLLGLNGVVIVSHGSSKAQAIKNAIRVAAESVNHRINEQIVETMLNCEFDVKARARATSLWRQLKFSIRHDNSKEKSDVEKKEESVPYVEQPQNIEASTAPKDQKPEESEQSKKFWWTLKELKHRDNDKEEAPVQEQEQPQEFPQNEVSEILTDAGEPQTQEQESEDERKRKKRGKRKDHDNV
jgi:hypothetical protein